jgi:hypothetical protein
MSICFVKAGAFLILDEFNMRAETKGKFVFMENS